MVEEEGKVRGEGGGLWECENRKVCGQLIIGLKHLALSVQCACVCFRSCVFSWCPEQPVGGGRRQQAGVFRPAENGQC